MSSVNALATTLKSAGYSVTKPRRAVFMALAKSDAVSMNQLVAMVVGETDRTSVYRTVDLFEKLDIIHRIHIGWKYKIELSEQFSSHHHHAVCTECGNILIFEESSDLEKGIHMLADSLKFQLSTHALELRGLCESCCSVVVK